jgi:AcrR family transcriptional regulator
MPKIVDKPMKRAEIARKAMVLFAREGFENTPIRKIAVQAGIGKGTFYDYFADKEDILNEIVKLMFTDWTEAMVAAIGDVDDPLEQLYILLKEGARLGDAMEALMVLYVDAWRRSVSQIGSPESIQTFRSLLISSRDAVAGIIEKAQDQGKIRKGLEAAPMASALIALIDGLCFHHMVLKPDFDADGVCRTFFNGFLNGIKG